MTKIKYRNYWNSINTKTFTALDKRISRYEQDNVRKTNYKEHYRDLYHQCRNQFNDYCREGFLIELRPFCEAFKNNSLHIYMRPFFDARERYYNSRY